MKAASGDTFILLHPTNSGLKKLIVEKNQNAPKPIPKNFSLATNAGYQSLLKARNHANMEELQRSDDCNSACSLFNYFNASPSPESCADDAPRTPTAKRQKKTVKSPSTALAATMTIDVAHGDNTVQVTCLRASLSKQRLFIKCDDTDISNVINLLRATPFDASMYRERDPSLNKGVWRRGAKFLVKTCSPSSKSSYATFDDRDKATVACGSHADASEEEHSDSEPAEANQGDSQEAVHEQSELLNMSCADGVLTIV